MSRNKFEDFNRLANNNMTNKGNLSEVLKAYLVLAQSMGKEEIAYESISELPPSQALNNPDPRVDIIISACGQNLENLKANSVSMVR